MISKQLGVYAYKPLHCFYKNRPGLMIKLTLELFKTPIISRSAKNKLILQSLNCVGNTISRPC